VQYRVSAKSILLLVEIVLVVLGNDYTGNRGTLFQEGHERRRRYAGCVLRGSSYREVASLYLLNTSCSVPVPEWHSH
jgi:hypothetical protein